MRGLFLRGISFARIPSCTEFHFRGNCLRRGVGGEPPPPQNQRAREKNAQMRLRGDVIREHIFTRNWDSAQMVSV